MIARLKLIPIDPIDRKINLTQFKSVTGKDANLMRVSLRELTQIIEKMRGETKEALPLIKAALFGDERSRNGSLRTNANISEITGVECDYDGGVISPDEAREILERASITSLIYTTPSHG